MLFEPQRIFHENKKSFFDAFYVAPIGSISYLCFFSINQSLTFECFLTAGLSRFPKHRNLKYRKQNA